MPQLKADLSISIRAGEKSFTLNCIRLPDNRFASKAWSACIAQDADCYAIRNLRHIEKVGSA